MYTSENRIRYSETDRSERLRLTSLLDYFQDASVFHSVDAQAASLHPKDKHTAWVTNAWQIIVHRYPVLGETVIIGTSPYAFKGFLGLRNFCMRTKDGEELAVANSVWSYVNLDTMMPERIPQKILDVFPLEEKLPMDYAPRKLPFPREGEVRRTDPVPVQAHHLDSNNHVNNGQFLKVAMDLVPEGRVIQMRAEYHRQALKGDIFYPEVHRRAEPDGTDCYTVALNDEAGAHYCVIELLQR